MTLWHRAPREVYRVYGQDEYLAQDDVHQAQQQERPSAPVVAEEMQSSRSGRLIGLGVLVGVTVGVLGLIGMNIVHRQGAGARSTVAQGTRGDALDRSSAASRTSSPTGTVAHVVDGEEAAVRTSIARRAPTSVQTHTQVRKPAVSSTRSSTRVPAVARWLGRVPSSAQSHVGFVPTSGCMESWADDHIAVSQVAQPDIRPSGVEAEFGFER